MSQSGLNFKLLTGTPKNLTSNNHKEGQKNSCAPGFRCLVASNKQSTCLTFVFIHTTTSVKHYKTGLLIWQRILALYAILKKILALRSCCEMLCKCQEKRLGLFLNWYQKWHQVNKVNVDLTLEKLLLETLSCRSSFILHFKRTLPLLCSSLLSTQPRVVAPLWVWSHPCAGLICWS